MITYTQLTPQIRRIRNRFGVLRVSVIDFSMNGCYGAVYRNCSSRSRNQPSVNSFYRTFIEKAFRGLKMSNIFQMTTRQNGQTYEYLRVSRVRSELRQPQAVSSKSDKREPIMEGVYRGFSGIQRSVVPSLLPEISTMRFHDGPSCDSLKSAMKDMQARCCGFPNRLETEEKGSQTDYRESEAQTSPWTPPYRFCRDESPEILTLRNFKWGRDLPAGMHEVEIINRMRMKRAWEAILPPMDSPANVKLRTKIISAIEIDEWNFREAEIQFVMDMRMELMEELTRARDEAATKRTEDRFRTVENTLEEQRDRKVNDIRRKLGRELRKLSVKHRSSSADAKWLKKYDVTKMSLTNLSNEFANNRQRFVDKPRSANAADNRTKTLLPTFEQLKMIKPKRRPWQLCERETRWTDETLKQLHAELKAVRLNLRPSNKKIELLKRKDKIPSSPVTPILEEKSSDNDDVEEAAVFLQKLSRGRTVQCAMFEDRDRCGKLMEKRQRMPVLEKCTEKVCRTEKGDASCLRRSSDKLEVENRTVEILNRMEGMTASEMMEFLGKEEERLSEERRSHACAMLAERERRRREAEASGSRDLEEHRCEECDEMFREMVKVNRESVQLYLEDVINEGIEWVSENEAKEYISQLADSMDDACRGKVEENIGDEVISDIIYNFVLPEVEKRIARKKIRHREQSYLRNAHAVIYDKIWEIPPMVRTKASVDASDDSARNESSEEIALASILEEEGVSSVEWIRQQIIEGSIDSGESLSTGALDYLISRAVLNDSEKIVADLLDDILQNVGINESTLSCELAEKKSNNQTLPFVSF